MTAQARSVVVRLTAETAQYIREMQAAGKMTDDAMSKAERSTSSASRAIDDLSGKAGMVGAAAAAGLGLLGKAAIDWESQWAGVEKTVDGTAQQMGVLEGELRGLARTMPASHREIAAVAEAAGQLGVAREDITDFTKTMIDLGETTNLTADDAATSIAQIANVMGTTGDEVDNFGAALVALGNDGASTEAQILAMTQRIAGAGAQIGLAESDILAIANAAASMGIEAEAGGSAISRVFTNLAKATKQGGDELDKFSRVAGMSAAEFARAFEEDPARAFAAFTQGLDQINKSGGDVFTTLDELKLSDVRVSQALLSMAASGDLLTDSLDLGASAWAENTALADEAAKRYDTTAAQIQVAWNQIRDAAIEAGGVLLPVVATIASGVGEAADAFGRLPGPVQNSVTGLLAITAVLGGGLWFTGKVIGAVNSTRDSLAALGLTGDKTAGSLGRVGRAAGIAGTALAALAAVDQLQRQFDGLDTGLEGVVQQLLNLAEAGGGTNLAGEFDNIAESFERLTDPNKAQAFQDSLYETFGFLGSDSRVDEAKAQFEALDAALTDIAVSGSAAEAKAAFEALADSMNLSAGDQEKLLDLLPQYSDALIGLDNDARTAAGGNEELADAAGTAAEAQELAASASRQQAEALKASREAAASTAESFVNLGDGLNDAEVSLGDWIGQLEAQADALANFRQNAVRAAEEGVRGGLIRALQEAGPEGAMRLEQLANATDAEIERANKAWRRGQREIDRYTDAVGGVPDAELDVDASSATQKLNRVEALLDDYGLTTATAKAALDDVASGKIKTVQGLIDKYGITKAEARALLRDQASGAIQSVRAQLAALDGDTATTYIRTVRSISTFVYGSANPTKRAGGGPVYGPGGPTDDLIPAMLSNREYVMPVSAVDRYGLDFMEAVRTGQLQRPEFADGGRPGWVTTNSVGGRRDENGSRSSARSLEDQLEIIRLVKEVRDLQRSLAADGKKRIKGLERRSAVLELRQARQELQQARRADQIAVRGAAAEFNLEGGMSRGDIRSEYAEFRRVLREAGVDLPKGFDRIRDNSLRLATRFNQVTRKLERSEEALESWRATAEDVSRQVAGIFDNDLYTGGLDAAFLQLEADRNDTAERDALLRAVAGLGLDTSSEAFRSLATSADMGTLRDLDTVEEARRFADLFASRHAAQTQAGQWASQAYIGSHIAALEATISRQEATLARLNHQLDRQEQRLEAATARGTERGTREGSRKGVWQAMNDQQRVKTAKAKAR